MLGAAESMSQRLRPGHLIVLESTTYPGTTREEVAPVLERSGLRAGRDFHLASRPSAVDPGRVDWTTATTPKVIGGLTPACTQRAVEVYGRACERLVPVGSPEVAELTKLLENIFRSVNIALVNELAILCDRMGIDVWEVIDAAATKPFGFMPFRPGPGLGGHCIPIDPSTSPGRRASSTSTPSSSSSRGRSTRRCPTSACPRSPARSTAAARP